MIDDVRDASSEDVTDGPSDVREANGEPSSLLEVRGVSVSYGDTDVLEGVSTTVSEGELVGLVGPNGAGKTTLLHAVSGAIEPDDGVVRVDGDDVRSLSSAAASRRIAVVPQETSLAFGFTVRQLVEMGRHPHRSRFERPSLRDRAIVDRAMERTRTAQFAERSIDEVSGGERQRVLLARALAQDAPLLLLDEPTANLDLHHAVETMALVRDLVDDGRQTAVAAIHDLELAARFCDRLLLLAGGDVVASGPPADVLDADRLEAAFGARTAVEPEPIGGGVAVEALADAGRGQHCDDELHDRAEPHRDDEVHHDDEPGPDATRRVHVVGGGLPAASALGALRDAGTELSVGPLPTGDRAAATARALDAAVVETPPFRAVEPDALDRARTLATSADAVVLAVADASEADDAQPCPDVWIELCEAVDGPLVALGASAPESISGRTSIVAASRDDLLDAVAAVADAASEPSSNGSRSTPTAPRADGGEAERGETERGDAERGE